MPEGSGSITSTWTWGSSAAAQEIGRLKQAQISGTGVTTYREIFSFDSLGRPSQTQYVEGANNYYVNLGYSAATGLLDTLTYPTSTSSYRLKLEYEYQNGWLARIKDYNAPATVFWAANERDARGNAIDVSLGNGLRSIVGIDPVTGWIDYLQSGPGGGSTVQNLSYQWDRAGNLTQRQDGNQSLTEAFVYDNLYRLDAATLNGVQNLDVSYDALGNVSSRSGLGSYAYSPTKLHAVTQITLSGGGTQSYAYDANGNMTSRNGTEMLWLANNLPKRIRKTPGSASNSSEFQYTAAGQRWRHKYNAAGANYTHVSLGGLVEKVTNGSVTDWRHLIQAEGRTVALYSRKSSGTNTLRYLLHDHLGSVDAITTAGGAVELRESFEAFGGRRGSAWSGVPSSAQLATMREVTRRGYTGHEHLDSTALIHLDGRVYDPALGRFVSADPGIDGALNTQGWNAYAYVKNNPLSFSDPTGFSRSPPTTRVLPIDPHSGLESITVEASRLYDNPIGPMFGFGGGGGLQGPEGRSGGMEEIVVTGRRGRPPVPSEPPDPPTLPKLPPPQGPEQNPTQCLNPAGTVGNDDQGSLAVPNVVFGGVDVEGYLIAGGGFHFGGFYDRSTGNVGWFFSFDLGGGLGANAGISGGIASNLSSFQGPTSVLGTGVGPVSGNYITQSESPTRPIAISGGMGANAMPPLPLPASVHVSKSFTWLFATSLPPCHGK